MRDIYDLYKPLRNLTRKYDLGSGLLTCYRFLQFLDFDKPLPTKLSHPGLITKLDRMRFGLLQWEFEILIREIILNSPEKGGKLLDTWSDVSKLINSIKNLENDNWGRTSRQESDVMYELVRISYRQFPWQAGFNRAYVARYHWLYRQPGLCEAISADYGMTPTELFQLGLSLVGHFLSEPLVELPLTNQINAVGEEVVNRFLQRLSMTIPEAKQRYKDVAEYNINWPYTFNPLRESPLLRAGNHLFCPIPNFLIRRLTSGIYFDLVKDSDLFSNYFGPAVQRLIGHAAKHGNSDPSFRILPEARFGTKRAPKDSVDWIISDETGHIFLESKGARVKFQGMSDLTNQSLAVST